MRTFKPCTNRMTQKLIKKSESKILICKIVKGKQKIMKLIIIFRLITSLVIELKSWEKTLTLWARAFRQNWLTKNYHWNRFIQFNMRLLNKRHNRTINLLRKNKKHYSFYKSGSSTHLFNLSKAYFFANIVCSILLLFNKPIISRTVGLLFGEKLTSISFKSSQR